MFRSRLVRVVLGLAAPLGVGFLGADRVSAQGGACAPVPLGGEVLVSRPEGDDRFPAVDVFPDGSAIVVYESNHTLGTDDTTLSIQARRLDASGVAAGEAFQVNTWTAGDQRSPDVAVAPDGRFAVVWQSMGAPGDDDGWSIRARAFGAGGDPLGDELLVNTSTQGDQTQASIDMASNGDFVVAWWHDSAAVEEVRARVFAADGTPKTGELQLNEYTNSVQWQPDVGMRSDGQFVAVWTSRGSFGSDAAGSFSIQARRYDASGQPLDNQEFQVNDFPAGEQTDPSVAVDPDGSFMVAWESSQSPGTDTDDSIQARGFLWSGTPASPQQQVNDLIGLQQEVPSIAPAGGREFSIVWKHNDTMQLNTEARGITLEGQFLGTQFTASDKAVNAAIGGNGQGRVIVVSQSDFQAMALKIVASSYDHPCAQGAPGACAESATVMCLNQDRFRITVHFNTAQGNSGMAQAVELTPDTGYFWFFNQENVEMVLKVLNACSFANHFWVFVGGLTDVELEITVEDIVSGQVRRYANPQKTPFQPIQDTLAFPTCGL